MMVYFVFKSLGFGVFLHEEFKKNWGTGATPVGDVLLMICDVAFICRIILDYIFL